MRVGWVIYPLYVRTYVVGGKEYGCGVWYQPRREDNILREERKGEWNGSAVGWKKNCLEPGPLPGPDGSKVGGSAEVNLIGPEGGGGGGVVRGRRAGRREHKGRLKERGGVGNGGEGITGSARLKPGTTSEGRAIMRRMKISDCAGRGGPGCIDCRDRGQEPLALRPRAASARNKARPSSAG